ncbi:MAG: hypothetical protein EOO67_10920, partial [Microbacterium sp.]
MLRLAPSHPPLWRTPSTLQFGTDDVARIDVVSPWQERVLHALDTGIADEMLVPLARTFGADEHEALRFAALIRPALASDGAAPVPVVVELPPDVAPGEASALQNALTHAGLSLVEVRTWPDETPGLPVVVVAHRMVEPRRAARLVAADIAHLPLELSGDSAIVGPLVVPGRSACLSCLHAHRTDADEQWPLLASQLLGRAPVPTDPGVLMEAALLGARLLRLPAAEIAMSATLSAGSVRRRWTA